MRTKIKIATKNTNEYDEKIRTLLTQVDTSIKRDRIISHLPQRNIG